MPFKETKFGFPAATLISVRLMQLQKAKLPMSVTVFGIVILVRLVQSLKARQYMFVTPSGIV